MDARGIGGNRPAPGVSQQTELDALGRTQKAKKSDVIDPNTAPKPTPEVAVSVSDQGRELSEARRKAFEIAKSTPDVREDRVAELKARIADGKYEVDSGKIADGMLREAVKEKLAEQEGVGSALL